MQESREYWFRQCAECHNSCRELSMENCPLPGDLNRESALDQVSFPDEMQLNPRNLSFVVAAVLTLGIRAEEPTYKGKTAVEWMDRVVADRTFNHFEAIEALREIGPSAVAPLVQLF